MLSCAFAAHAQNAEPAYTTLANAKPEAVIAALDSEDVYTRELALAQIARENRAPELTRAAADAVASVRQPGVKAQLIAVLAERGDASVAPVIREELKNADPAVREAAVAACGRLKDVQAADTLFGMLDGDQAEAVREALRRIPNPTLDARLAEVLANGEGTNRVVALELLAARRYARVFELALDKRLFDAGDPSLAKAAAAAIRAYAPSDGFERLLAFALSLSPPSADLLTGTLSAAIDEAPKRAVCERQIGGVLAWCDASHAPLLTALLATSQGAEARSILSKRLLSDDLETRKDAIRNLGKWNGEAALEPLVLAARRERDAGAQTLAWRAVIDIVRRADTIKDFYQPVSAIQQTIWYAPRREERVAALQALPLYHPKAWEVEWLLTKVEKEKPLLAEEAKRVKDGLVPPFSGLLGR